MVRVRFCLLAGVVAFVLPAAAAAQPAAHARTRHRAHRRIHVARPRPAPGYGYASDYSPTPDCRYPDGTPFDPDIIGGPNHVGDGGPAVNLGGFAPCGY